ncbi:MAG TPA: NAD(P)/FAD-dependent oxidoreductase [Roseiarcus sp.]|jgi:cation diffusion facilitator CzcD-associated flavoprotein CzcO
MNEAILGARVHDERLAVGAASGHFDVLIIGAGLSGIGTACHLVQKRPRTTFAVLEARNAIGGTWDLFRYPGIRSDSDMSTFGYTFRPWDNSKAIADGPSILRYLAETAKVFGVDRHIRFGFKVVRASWRSAEASWTLNVDGPNGEKLGFSCSFLMFCTGYYEYEEGYMPGWPGMEAFSGRIVHPQKWPEDLDYCEKRVVVIGSGATAVTIVPAMAARAAHVVMLQRSPTYVVARPAEEAIAKRLRQRLPARLTHTIIRWKSILLQMYLYRLSRRKPAAVRAEIIKLAQAELGPELNAAEYFNPRYEPWDQRMCLIPDGDLFAAMRAGKASIVNGEIETFTETGLRLSSGQEIGADIIVTATGLKVRLMGCVAIEVDGAPVDIAAAIGYRGAMLSDIPNLASIFGYTNASWTLKSDLIAGYVCRLLGHMDRRGYAICTPRLGDTTIAEEPTLPLTSGYIERAKHLFFKQGTKKPWRLNQNYALDVMALRFGAIEDGVLEFRRRGPVSRAA